MKIKILILGFLLSNSVWALSGFELRDIASLDKSSAIVQLSILTLEEDNPVHQGYLVRLKYLLNYVSIEEFSSECHKLAYMIEEGDL